MKIKNEDIKIFKDPHEVFTPACFEIIREIVVQGKYLIAGIEKVEPDFDSSYWILCKGAGDEKFFKFLRDKAVINRKFPSMLEVEAEIFPLIQVFLADKPNDYLEPQTRSTMPVFVAKPE